MNTNFISGNGVLLQQMPKTCKCGFGIGKWWEGWGILRMNIKAAAEGSEGSKQHDRENISF